MRSFIALTLLAASSVLGTDETDCAPCPFCVMCPPDMYPYGTADNGQYGDQSELETVGSRRHAPFDVRPANSFGDSFSPAQLDVVGYDGFVATTTTVCPPRRIFCPTCTCPTVNSSLPSLLIKPYRALVSLVQYTPIVHPITPVAPVSPTITPTP